MSRKEEILTQIRAIPELPGSALQFMELAQDDNASAADLVKPLEYDPGLTSNVLRMANSAYFAGPGQISSLRDAIVRLGLNRVYQLVATAAVSPLAKRPIRGYDLPPGKLLEHAIFVAICAEEIAKAVGLSAPSHTFTSGLLHNVGKIVLGTFIEADGQRIIELSQREEISFEEAEERILGINHAEAGAVLLEQWCLPENIIQVVRWHHRPDDFPGDPLVVDLVHVADILGMESGFGMGLEGMRYRPSEDVVERLGLRPLAAEKATCNALSAMEELRDLFQLPSGKE